MSDMAAIEVAYIVKSIMVRQLAADCDDKVAALDWYDRNTDVWDAEKLRTHAPDDTVALRRGDCPGGKPARREGQRLLGRRH